MMDQIADNSTKTAFVNQNCDLLCLALAYLIYTLVFILLVVQLMIVCWQLCRHPQRQEDENNNNIEE